MIEKGSVAKGGSATPETDSEAGQLPRIERLSDLVSDDELLIDLIVSYLQFHKIVADQVGIPDLIRKVRELTPAEIVEAVVTKVVDENRD